MKKIFNLLSCLVIAVVIIVPMYLHAETVQELQTKFTDLGGSDGGFEKIIKVVQDAQKANDDLKDKIQNVYNPQLSAAMTADSFDATKYNDIFNAIDHEKSLLIQQNLKSMSSLLASLSIKDRAAYAQLLYGVPAKAMQSPTSSAAKVAPPPTAADNKTATDTSNTSNATESSVPPTNNAQVTAPAETNNPAIPAAPVVQSNTPSTDGKSQSQAQATTNNM